jgi:carboxylesterase
MVDRRPTDVSLHTDSNVLVYLIHGVTGTPAEMYPLARGMARHGWDVYSTTLPGHCTRLTDLVRTNEQDWLSHVQRQLAFVRGRYEHVFVAGLSVGALIALQASTTVCVEGLGVLSPTIVYDGWNVPWTHRILRPAIHIVPRPLQYLLFHMDGPPFGIKDQELQARMRAAYNPLGLVWRWVCGWARLWKRRDADRTVRGTEAASTGYPVFPLKTFADMDRLIAQVCGQLGSVSAPTVILQAREDDMTSPHNAYLVYDKIASTDKQVILLEDCYHVITVDKQSQTVVRHLIEFFHLRIAAKRQSNQAAPSTRVVP